jgi:hypothetical protein
MLPSVNEKPPSPVGWDHGYESLTISAYADKLNFGDRKGGLMCPYCHGGGSREASFSMISYHDGVQWKCWRASCGRKGKLNLKSGMFWEGADVSGLESFEARSARTASSEDRAMLYNLCVMTDEWKDCLKARFGILPEAAIRKGWNSNKSGDLVIPLKGCNGQVVGHEFRKMVGEPKSKMNLLNTKYFPRNAFSTNSLEKDTVLIVEDSISALKASIVCRTYSLQGTNMVQNHIEELADNWPAKRYLIALDKDATEKAVNYILRYKFMLPGLELCPIQKDLKYYYVSEIQQLVESYK